MMHSIVARTRRWGWAAWMLAVAGLMAGPAHAQNVRFVRWNAPPGGTGMSWATAYIDLQAALAAAAANPTITQIWIAQGTYKPAGPGGPRTATFTLRNGLGLYGGFAGNESSLAQRNIAANPTTLSGDLNGDGPGAFTGVPPATLNDNSYHVVTGSGINATARLDGLRILDGAAMDISPNNAGAGLHCTGASPTVDHCTFMFNYAADRGGAISLIAGSAAAITFCHFEQNRTLLGSVGSGFGGGAIYLLGSDAYVADCTFQTNRFVAGANGGAILGAASVPTFLRCTFTGNGDVSGLTGLGGGIYLINSAAGSSIAQCTFAGNRGTGGGSIALDNSQVLIRDSLFQRGSASIHAEGGGAISSLSSNPVIVRCTFDRLVAEGGGAIANSSSAPLIVNCRFTGNSCFLFDGGALWNRGNSAPLVVNCTFTGNASTGGAGGSAAIFHDATGALTVVNSTFAANSANPAIPGAGALGGGNTALHNCVVVHNTPAQVSGVTATYSCVQGGWPGVGNINSVNPAFVDENGPDNIIGTPDDDVRLMTGSPCIDAGRNVSVPADTADLDGDGNVVEPTPRDLALGPRFYDHAATPDTGLGVPPIVDMGAFEVRACPADVAPAPQGNGVVDVNDLLAVITTWGPCPAPCPPRCAGDIAPVVGGVPVGNCQVDVNDLLAVVTTWGACP